MISFPPCKINLGLNIISKRPDGFHDIETCFYPVPWTDILEIIPSDVLEFSSSGVPIPGSPQENLCLRAYQIIKKDFDVKPVKINLHKIIPMGAGLGGGSSNAAYTLRMLNTIFELQLTIDQLKRYASQLGSDCAFFCDDKPMIGKGRGEELEEVEIKLKNKFIILVKPDIHIATAGAYVGVKPAPASKKVKDVVENSALTTWKTLLRNDFEDSVFKKYASIKEIKETLYQSGAIYSSMSGSGSAVFGIFDKRIDLREKFPELIYWSGSLQ